MYREGSETDYDSIKSRQPSVASSSVHVEQKQKLSLSSSSSSSSSSSKASVSAQPVYSNTADPVYANAEKIQKSRPPSTSLQSPSLPSTTWKGEEERNTWDRKDEASRSGHRDIVDGHQEGLEGKLTAEQSKRTSYSSSESETSSSDEEIVAAARTEDGNFGEREVTHQNFLILEFSLTLIPY